MNLYIKRNLQINQLFRQFAAEEDVWPYSIDESILDMTHSWHLFGASPRQVARLIQKTVRQKLGLYTTVGIGDNPVQAKIALDIYAKHTPDLIGEIHYATVPQTIWPIQQLTAVWGIGERTAKRLNHLQIHNMNDLAHANPYDLKQAMGMIGEQVAARLRHHRQLAGRLSLAVGFSYAAAKQDGQRGFHQAMTIDPTDDDRETTRQLLFLFRQNWTGQAVRNLAVYASQLVPNTGQQLTLFTDPQRQIKAERLNGVIDEIHQRFGFSKLVFATSLIQGGTAIERSQLVGGHNGGNSYA